MYISIVDDIMQLKEIKLNFSKNKISLKIISLINN